MAETILSSPFFVEGVLPFVLIFTIVFAILQKTEILGKGKRQIDAITALVIGLIVISFANAVNIINSLLPFLAVALVIIIIFMILYGMFYHGNDFKINDKLRIAGGIIVAVAVVIAVMVVTGGWTYLGNLFSNSGSGEGILANIIFIAIVVGAVVVVMMSAGKGKDDKKKDD